MNLQECVENPFQNHQQPEQPDPRYEMCKECGGHGEILKDEYKKVEPKIYKVKSIFDK